MDLNEFHKSYPEAYRSDVKWGEMDSLKHVNNIIYFRYFECSRMKFWERLEDSLQAEDSKEIGPILASTSCKFIRPLFYPDTILVGSKVLSLGKDRFTMEHAIWSENKQHLVAVGEAVIVSYNYKTMKKTMLPKSWENFLQKNSKDH